MTDHGSPFFYGRDGPDWWEPDCIGGEEGSGGGEEGSGGEGRVSSGGVENPAIGVSIGGGGGGGSGGRGGGGGQGGGGGEDDDSDEEVVLPTDTEFLVAEAMSRLPPGAEVSLELRPCDIDEDRVVEDFMRRGCSCRKWGGKPCSEQFSVDYIRETRLSFKDLTREQLDLILMGQLIATTNTSTITKERRHQPQMRKHGYSTGHFHQGNAICVEMFRFIHGIGEKRLRNISKALRLNGIAPRVHGNTRRLPKNTLSKESVEYVVRFLLNYSEQHGLLLPGRVPGYARDDIKLLPSSKSKRGIWRIYHEAAEQDPSVHAVAYTTFCRLWKALVPSLIIMKPMTDLCWTCQQNSSAILRASNFPERVKSDVLKKAEEHLFIVQKERSFYKTKCKECEDETRAHFNTGDDFQPPPLASQTPANSRDFKAHYSFDYAQQVHFPSDPLQPGPIYFLVPRKCSVFGVCCEAIPRQVNFLCDEAGDCGKGANTVVSQLHYFFENHGLGEKEVFLHADNCTGQNKNSCMLQYLAWRVMTGRHTEITLSFLVVGHTKFSPDWCFGLFKRLYRRSRVGSLQAIAQIVNDSAHCNFAQLNVTEDGAIVVPTLSWTDFFAPHLKKVSGIKKLHHFRFPSSEPGVVYVRVHSDGDEEKIELLKDKAWRPGVSHLPCQVTPKGLSADRQWYLFDKIREFCPEADRDVTCPQPAVPKSTSRAGTPAPAAEDEDSTLLSTLLTPPRPTSRAGTRTSDNIVSLPPPKKSRLCSTCRREGHNSRTCPNK